MNESSGEYRLKSMYHLFMDDFSGFIKWNEDSERWNMESFHDFISRITCWLLTLSFS